MINKIYLFCGYELTAAMPPVKAAEASTLLVVVVNIFKMAMRTIGA